MVRKKKEDWYEFQENEMYRKYAWYLFKQFETKTSLSIKTHFRYYLRLKKKKKSSFVYYHVSNFLKLTPKNFIEISPEKIKSESGYNLDQLRLNLSFLFTYLENKNVKLSQEDIDVIDVILNNNDIRNFLFDWNKKKDEGKSYKNIVVYSFEKPLLEVIITFLRVIYHYDKDMIVDHVLDKDTAKEYIKISKIIHSLKYDSKTRKSFFNALEKIDNLYDIMPVALRKFSNDLSK